MVRASATETLDSGSVSGRVKLKTVRFVLSATTGIFSSVEENSESLCSVASVRLKI